MSKWHAIIPASSYKCASSNNDGSNEFLNNGFAVASEVDDPEDEVPERTATTMGTKRRLATDYSLPLWQSHTPAIDV
jgi:hypothetical protein